MIRMNLYSQFSLYSRLISTEDSDVISKSHSMLSPFDEYIRDKNDKEQLLLERHGHFLEDRPVDSCETISFKDLI